MVKPMLPTMSEEAPDDNDWTYEIKYDGFRAILEWTDHGITLTSRNGKDLSDRFPEIIDIAKDVQAPSLPITLDGELVILNTPFQANFPLLQQRGRLRTKTKIQAAANDRPATFMAFDCLHHSGKKYNQRKKNLHTIINKINTPRIQYVKNYRNLEEVTSILLLHSGEGMVAKLMSSTYQPGTRTKQWLKIKQWRTVSGFLTSYNPDNGYYQIEMKNESKHEQIGRFKNGIDPDEEQTLRTFFKEKGKKKNGVWKLDPSVCVDVNCLHAEDEEMREPMFNRFRFDLTPSDCNTDKLAWDLSLFPDNVKATNTDKKLWPSVTKQDYLIYMRTIAPYLLPFIKGKKVTLIRYPDGIHEQSFYQKHLPEHAPNYVDQWVEDDETFIRCQNLSALTWLANQGALEYHIPFQQAGAKNPDEIVFDLDPPSREYFSLAIIAAQLLKGLLDELHVHSFVKTSGNKGMQIHIPIEEGSMSYEETRKITESLALLLVKEKPDLFTVERLKKKRGDRLYLDYVQHAEGKTIIAPYSSRATEHATVSAPLYWHEVKADLRPENFTISTVIERVKKLGCPFNRYHEARFEQPIKQLKDLIQ